MSWTGLSLWPNYHKSMLSWTLCLLWLFRLSFCSYPISCITTFIQVAQCTQNHCFKRPQDIFGRTILCVLALFLSDYTFCHVATAVVRSDLSIKQSRLGCKLRVADRPLRKLMLQLLDSLICSVLLIGSLRSFLKRFSLINIENKESK